MVNIVTLINKKIVPEDKLYRIATQLFKALRIVIAKSVDAKKALQELKKFCSDSTANLAENTLIQLRNNKLLTSKNKFVKYGDNICDAVIANDFSNNPIAFSIVEKIETRQVMQ